MATAGQIITNKVTGEKLKYLQTAKDTNGKLVQFELWASPKGFMPVRHLHPTQAETIEVASGVFKAECDGDIHYLQPGEKITIDKFTTLWGIRMVTGKWQKHPVIFLSTKIFMQLLVQQYVTEYSTKSL